MHYYKRNLGDYAKKAGRLSMIEHGAYTLLLDACYDRERFPTLEEAIEWTWARTPEEVAAVNKHRARKVWQTRQTHLCRCDHNEYCQHCWPESFRPGGVWHGLGA